MTTMRAPYAYLRVSVGPIVCGRKFCAGCGRWRHVIDFSVHARKPQVYLDSYCRGCRRRWRRAYLADPAVRERHREYHRFWTDAQRRAAGIPARDWPASSRRGGGAGNGSSGTLPIEPLIAVLEAYARGWYLEHGVTDADVQGVSVQLTARRRIGPWRELATLANVPERRIWGIRHGEYRRVSTVTADRLCVALDVPLETIYYGLGARSA